MVITGQALRAHADWVARGAVGDGRLTLRGDDAGGQDLRSAQLSGAILESCNLEGALLSGTTWSAASVTRTSFRDAVFGDARLDDARFIECDLRDADFSDLDARARGSTARCRFERCDLRGSIWLERNVAGACFVDCQFDLVVGAPRNLSNVEIDRPRLATPEGSVREATAAEVLAFWGSGKLLPHLSDDDKAYVRRGLQGGWRKREAYIARGPRPPAATGVGSLADKWSEPFLPTVGAIVAPVPRPPAGEPVELPAGTPAGVSARRGPSGVTVYRDARSGFGIALPSPFFLAPSEYMDATAGVANTAIVHLTYLKRAANVTAEEEAITLARDLTDQEPELLELTGQGIVATALASSRHDDAMRKIAVFIGGDAERSGVAIVNLSFSTDELDAATFRALWTALLGSVWFGPERDRIPELVPPSVWWEPGWPLELAASRPALPRRNGLRAVGLAILGDSGLLAPTDRLGDGLRAELARRIAGADLRVTGALETVHDLRGLATALIAAEAEAAPRDGLVSAAGGASHAPAPVAPAAVASASDDALEAAAKARVLAGAASARAALAAPGARSAGGGNGIGINDGVHASDALPLPPPPTMPIPSGAVNPSAPILAAHRVVTVTAAEAVRTGLPAVGMTVDLGGTQLMERGRAEGRCYLMAGGPPGGALGFEVWSSDETATDPAAIQRATAAHYPMSTLTRGLAGTLTIAGGARPALTFLEGPAAHDPTHLCATLVPHARGAVLVVLSLSHLGRAPVSCDRLVSYPDLARAATTFALVES